MSKTPNTNTGGDKPSKRQRIEDSAEENADPILQTGQSSSSDSNTQVR